MSGLCSKYAMGNCIPKPPVTTTATTSVGTPVHTNTSQLPFTGGDVIGLSVLGTMLLASGAAFIRRGRRRTA